MKSRIISLSFSVLGGNKAGLGGIGCRLSPYIHFFLFGCCSIPSFVRISCSFRDETERLKQLFRDSQQLFRAYLSTGRVWCRLLMCFSNSFINKKSHLFKFWHSKCLYQANFLPFSWFFFIFSLHIIQDFKLHSANKITWNNYISCKRLTWSKII